MYAITMQNFGAPDVLEWTTVPSPALGHGEVRIDVVATAVNRADLMQRQGFYPPPPGASPAPSGAPGSPPRTWPSCRCSWRGTEAG